MEADVTRCHVNASFPMQRDCLAFDPCSGHCHYGYQPYQFDMVMRKPSSLVTYGQIYPILVTVTVIANIFVAIVLSRKHMQSPTNLVLLYMAIADLSVALVPLPFIFFYILLGNYRSIENMKVWWCYLAMYTAESVPPFCHNVAIWLTVLLATQRYIFIKFPLKAQQICSLRRVKVCAAVIVIVSMIATFPKLADITSFKLLKWEIIGDDNETINSNYTCIFAYSSAVQVVGVNVYYSVYYWLRVVLFVMIPSFLLVVFSLLLILGIHEANQRRKRMFRDVLRRESLKNKEKNTVNLMLLIIVIIFLIVNLPQGVMLALVCFHQVTNFRVDKDTVLLVSNIDNMLILATYPVNFAIYCGMSAQFRETFKELFKKGPHNLTWMERFRSSRSLLLKSEITDLPLLSPKSKLLRRSAKFERNGEADVIL